MARCEIDRVVHPAGAERTSDLALAMSGDAVAALAAGKAQAAVVAAKNPAPAGTFKALITVDDPRLALARLTALFDPGPAHGEGVHPTAIVAPDAQVGEGVSIGPYAVVGPRSRIGAGTVHPFAGDHRRGRGNRRAVFVPCRRAHRRSGQDRKPGHHPR